MLRKTFIAVAAVLALSFLGAMDYSDALVQDATEKDARPLRVTDPLPYINSASVCQRTYYAERPACRYYRSDK